jgi:prolyl 4-hydroxylase
MTKTGESRLYYEPTIPFAQQRSDVRAAVGQEVGEKLDGTAGVLRLPTSKERPVQLYMREDFLSADECEALCRQIDTSNFPSALYQKEKYEGIRTSYSCNLSPYDPLVAEVEDRLVELLGIDRSWGEPLQGQRYETGQQFKEHTDFFYVDQPYWPEYEEQGGQRTWTAMIYLNLPQKGGATRFSFLDLRVEPRLGRLLIWNNMALDGSPNPWTLHEGERVEEGIKYIVTKWYRERRFD